MPRRQQHYTGEQLQELLIQLPCPGARPQTSYIPPQQLMWAEYERAPLWNPYSGRQLPESAGEAAGRPKEYECPKQPNLAPLWGEACEKTGKARSTKARRPTKFQLQPAAPTTHRTDQPYTRRLSLTPPADDGKHDNCPQNINRYSPPETRCDHFM